MKHMLDQQPDLRSPLAPLDDTEGRHREPKHAGYSDGDDVRHTAANVCNGRHCAGDTRRVGNNSPLPHQYGGYVYHRAPLRDDLRTDESMLRILNSIGTHQ